MKNIFACVAVCSITATSYILPVFAHESKNDTAFHSQSGQVATDKQHLMAKLAKISQFSATFTQQVIAEDGTELMPSEGKLAVKKPNLVFWHTEQPEETTIVSDGNTLWFYDPFVEQATAYSVNDSIANTPILLLTSTDESLWQDYQVTQTSTDTFVVSSLLPDSRITSLELTFSPDSAELSRFAFTDTTGQKSVIMLLDIDSSSKIASSKFEFTVPEGIYVDDQR